MQKLSNGAFTLDSEFGIDGTYFTGGFGTLEIVDDSFYVVVAP